MYELSRVRLHSIGPPGARFGDVLLDFSGVGAPVAGPRQDGLFPTTPRQRRDAAVPAGPALSSVPSPAAPVGPGRTIGPGTATGLGTATAGTAAAPSAPSRPLRPSPASVLFLENGGGKSVLIKLIFSVVLPGRRHVVGTSNGRVLDNFVLPGDCGHVTCEWQHAVTGQRVVTGKVSEWRGRGAADAARLTEAWYSFRPGGGLEITSLPLTAEGRQLTLAGLRGRLHDAHEADPALDLTWETHQGAWREHLDAVGLDPELFRYQRAMNAGEGEAAEAFSFGSDEQFVDFLLRAVTPPEDPAGIADVVDGYATKLAERAALGAERDFVAGALTRLTPLADAVERRAGAGAAYAAARARIADLHDGVRARVRRDAAALAGLAAQVQAARDAERDADEARSRRQGAVLALRRRIAELRLAEAERERDRLVAGARDAAAEIDAWRATEDVLRLAAASAEAERLTRLVADAEDVAAPALADRDGAARALLGGLNRLAEASSDAALRAEAEAGEHDRRAGAAERADRRASDEAAQARAREQALHQRRAAALDALAAAARAGLIAPGGTDLARQAQRAAAEAQQAAAAVRDALSHATDAQDRGPAQATTRAAQHRAVAAGAALDRLTGRLDEARAGAAALLAGGRLAELLGDAGPSGGPNEAAGEDDTPSEGAHRVLDAVAEAAGERLAEAIGAAEARRLDLSVAADADRRLLGALGEGGLRPPREEVAAAVDVLQAAGIAAVAGWSHLAHAVPAARREQVLRARPHLADGVIITARVGHARIREVLDAAALLPDSVVAVGGVDDLLDDADPVIDGERITMVRPNPALYDTAAAAAEREAIRARQDERVTLAAALSDRIAVDRDLAAALTGWRRSHPAGHLDRLEAQLTAARDTLAAAESELAAAGREAAAAEQAARRALADVEPLRVAAAEAAARATALDQLARSVGDPAATEREIEQVAGVAEDRLAEARAAREHAASQRRAAAEAVRRADEARRNAAAARAESVSVVGAGDAAVTVREGDGPEPPVAVLRAAYEAASRTYAQVEVGADLRGEVDRARREEAAARAAVEAFEPAVRARARALLAGVSGGDSATRAAGEARARRAAAVVGAELDDAREQLGALREELRTATAEVQRRGVAPLAGEQVPTDLGHAGELLRAAAAAVEHAEDGHARARAVRDDLVERSARHTDELDAFTAIAESLADLPAATSPPVGPASADTGGTGGTARTGGAGGSGRGASALAGPARDDPSPVDEGAVAVPFAGDARQARENSHRLRLAWREAAAAYGQAAGAVRTAAEAVTAWAAQDRFDAVRTPARRQMLRAGREAVADGAAAWAQALAPRLRSLDDDLAHIGRNREAIVARLEGMVRAALGTLRAAGRLSRLPDRLGDWSGQDFLRITFAEPDDRALTEALGRVVDETAAAAVAARPRPGAATRVGADPGGARGARAAAAVRHDGMGLLLRGVRAAIPRGVRVEILKPDAVLRTERVRVSELGDVFSGGQQLTAAIILYCTMAALRANDRGQLRAPHAGVLFLDNPIGRASAGYLLDLQLAVADRLGVQLIYTTGLFDTAALAAFPLIVRLRNDADLRAGRKYLRVEERLQPGLTPAGPVSAQADGTGVITATRLYARPPTPTPTDDEPGAPPTGPPAGDGH
ncbi:hypothetical protein [Frankia sp. AvcI1]|uniref:hypothetical protein n=2 Tax=Frankia sp. AvcI1 TaxID=573496 RepID=UPI00211748AA|nr:hypothetical protein [Frankia sp. AvcI1]